MGLEHHLRIKQYSWLLCIIVEGKRRVYAQTLCYINVHLVLPVYFIYEISLFPKTPVTIYPCLVHIDIFIDAVLGLSMCLEEGVRLPNLTQSFVAINQEALSRCSHEIGIAMNVLASIHPGHHLFKKRLDLLDRTIRLELRDPNRSTVCHSTGGSDVRFEVLGGSSAVPVQSANMGSGMWWTTYQWMLIKPIVQPLHRCRNFASQPRLVVSETAALVTAGEPR